MTRTHQLNLSYRLAVFYAVNPTIVLTGQELARKFGTASSLVRDTLRPSERMGIVRVTTAGVGRHTIGIGAALENEL
jgi:hypothetical protein